MVAEIVSTHPLVLSAMIHRSYLFLQGVCSPFFRRLGGQLRANGHSVHKVNFTAGDIAYWGIGQSSNFFGQLCELRGFLEDLYSRYGVTDQVLFGDRRPIHRPAVDLGDTLGIRTHVFEEGYFRPHWVTLERGGVNGHSQLPRDPEWFWAVGGDSGASDCVERFDSPFFIRAAHDVAYHLAGAANLLVFPRYCSHAGISAPVEYAGYIRRFSMLNWWKPRDAEFIQDLVRREVGYFVFPLQLNTDAQIRDHSRFENILEAICYVIESFANCAPAGSRLVIKNHPLDTGLINYRAAILKQARDVDASDRVDYIESGNLELLLRHARGLVTVNSTVGGVALGLGCPTTALSDPIYNLPGLTYQGALDDFWTQGERPNRELFRRFRNAVIYTTQVNGGFYCNQGIALAVRNSLALLENENSMLGEVA